MYSVVPKDEHCAGKLFLVWGAFGLGMADAAVWGLGLVAAFGLLLGTQAL